MRYRDVIYNRKSVRAFKNKELTQELLSEIGDFYTSCQRLVPEIETELLLMDDSMGKQLEEASGYESAIAGKKNYMILMSDQHDLMYQNAGFILEELVLKLVDMEIDSCWITFENPADVKAALNLNSDKEIGGVVAIGYGERLAKQMRFNKKTMANATGAAKRHYYSQKKDIDELTFVEEWGRTEGLDDVAGFYDDILWNALYAVSLTPSYMNRQPFKVILKDHKVVMVSEADEFTDEISRDLNVGVAMSHFAGVISDFAAGQAWQLTDIPEVAGMPESCRATGVFSL